MLYDLESNHTFVYLPGLEAFHARRRAILLAEMPFPRVICRLHIPCYVRRTTYVRVSPIFATGIVTLDIGLTQRYSMESRKRHRG